jgi:hypothetical protein
MNRSGLTLNIDSQHVHDEKRLWTLLEQLDPPGVVVSEPYTIPRVRAVLPHAEIVIRRWPDDGFGSPRPSTMLDKWATPRAYLEDALRLTGHYPGVLYHFGNEWGTLPLEIDWTIAALDVADELGIGLVIHNDGVGHEEFAEYTGPLAPILQRISPDYYGGVSPHRWGVHQYWFGNDPLASMDRASGQYWIVGRHQSHLLGAFAHLGVTPCKIVCTEFGLDSNEPLNGGQHGKGWKRSGVTEEELFRQTKIADELLRELGGLEWWAIFRYGSAPRDQDGSWWHFDVEGAEVFWSLILPYVQATRRVEDTPAAEPTPVIEPAPEPAVQWVSGILYPAGDYHVRVRAEPGLTARILGGITPAGVVGEWDGCANNLVQADHIMWRHVRLPGIGECWVSDAHVRLTLTPDAPAGDDLDDLRVLLTQNRQAVERLALLLQQNCQVLDALGERIGEEA